MRNSLGFLASPRCLVWAIVGIGIGFRAFHYLRDPSVWQDEASVVLNLLDKGFVDLLGKPDYHAASPPLFLWLERAMVLLFGDSTYALRFLPFAAGVLALILLVPVAQRLLSPRGVFVAAALMAASDRLLWHACEAKPYSLDALLGVLVIGMYLATENWTWPQRLAWFALSAPGIVFLSYPGCFLLGGLVVACALGLQRDQAWTRKNFIRLGLFVSSTALSFLALLAGPIRAQRSPQMASCWEAGYFPDPDHLLSWPWWMVRSTVQMVDYCCRPAGGPMILLLVLGAVLLWRRRKRAEVALMVVPMMLACLAALARSYPYGGARVMVFALPAVVLLIAAGADAVFDFCWNLQRRSLARPALGAGLAAYLFLPLGYACYRVGHPWPRPECSEAAHYVLDQWQPGDQVVGNSWEQRYYFRNVNGWLAESEAHCVGSSRRWLVITSQTPLEHRWELARSLAPLGWDLVRDRDFHRVTVFLSQSRDLP